MSTKEEILSIVTGKSIHYLSGNFVTLSDALKAMEFYAKQERVEFAKWCSITGWKWFDSVELWCKSSIFRNTEQLYDIFVKYKKENP
jgi:hypothetical protein